MATTFHALAILGSAAFAGVMLAIALILGPLWRGLPPAEFLAWFAAHGGSIARTIPLVLVPTLVGLTGSVACGGGTRPLWLAALACIGVLLALTAAWFLPMNARFAAGTIPVAEVAAALDRWLALHWLRIALALAAAGLGLLAAVRQIPPAVTA